MITARDILRGTFRLSIVVALLAAAPPVVAGPLEDAVAAYERRDYQTALRLLSPLAEQGNARAQLFVGLMHYRGEGVPQSFAEALKWYRLAANQGDGFAQIAVGSMYAAGESVPQSFAEALKWYRLAANNGQGHAQLLLGNLYAGGKGVAQDYVRAHMWYNLAAAQDVLFAKEQRDGIALKMTPAQIAEAQKLAREWKPTP